MKYAVEMGSAAMICIPSFIRLVQALKIDWTGYRHTDSMAITEACFRKVD
jgi:hypothetical protein